MNINRKYIIIFGTLVLLLVIIFGGITYYKERKEQADIISGISKNLPNRRITTFPQNYPIDLSELSDFIGFCKNAVFSDIEELKNNEIKKVACVLAKVREDSPYIHVSSSSYIPSFSPLDSIISFKPDRYIGISVDLKDVVREYDSSLLEKDKLYFCSVSEPSWTDPFYLQMEPKQDLIFDEGDVSCGGIKMDKTPAITFSGFIPDAEFLSNKLYLVNEQIESDVMNKQSFSKIKEILKDYPIIWQMEKPIIP